MIGRPSKHDLYRDWKLSMPATLAGAIEWKLMDPIHRKPIYGARQRLLTSLLEFWLAREHGQPLPEIPTLDELRREFLQ